MHIDPQQKRKHVRLPETGLRVIHKAGTPITSLEEWAELAGPKRASQWRDHRSAKEAARAWLDSADGGLPGEIEALFQRSPDFTIPTRWEAEPETHIPFDHFRGEPANLDLLLVGEDELGEFIAGIEAKADEPFSVLVSAALESGLERLTKSPNSKAVRRIERLASALFVPRARGTVPIAALRYQLLTASAAVLAEAERRGVSRAVLMIHEFITPLTRPENLERNAADFARYVRRLAADPDLDVNAELLSGPFRVPGDPIVTGPASLWIGKATRQTRREA